MEKKTPKAIKLNYKFRIGESWINKSYIATTYEDYHRIVRILHENEEHYRVISVRRV